MNKQIEEMARTMCGEKEHSCAECDSCNLCEFWIEAQILYANEYRKSTDVAREIFEEIKKHLVFNTYGIATISEKTFAELKKKYESEGADDE